MAHSRSTQGTRQVNLALTPTQEELVRLLVLRLREGGVEYEQRGRDFVQEAPVPRYMHVHELDRRFGALERRILDLEELLARGGTAERGD
jgi:polyhydroxyalkanoate synthesis regulator phasin